jgi:hypothetical protein
MLKFYKDYQWLESKASINVPCSPNSDPSFVNARTTAEFVERSAVRSLELLEDFLVT